MTYIFYDQFLINKTVKSIKLGGYKNDLWLKTKVNNLI